MESLQLVHPDVFSDDKSPTQTPKVHWFYSLFHFFRQPDIDKDESSLKFPELVEKAFSNDESTCAALLYLAEWRLFVNTVELPVQVVSSLPRFDLNIPTSFADAPTLSTSPIRSTEGINIGNPMPERSSVSVGFRTMSDAIHALSVGSRLCHELQVVNLENVIRTALEYTPPPSLPSSSPGSAASTSESRSLPGGKLELDDLNGEGPIVIDDLNFLESVLESQGAYPPSWPTNLSNEELRLKVRKHVTSTFLEFLVHGIPEEVQDNLVGVEPLELVAIIIETEEPSAELSVILEQYRSLVETLEEFYDASVVEDTVDFFLVITTIRQFLQADLSMRTKIESLTEEEFTTLVLDVYSDFLTEKGYSDLCNSLWRFLGWGFFLPDEVDLDSLQRQLLSYVEKQSDPTYLPQNQRTSSVSASAANSHNENVDVAPEPIETHTEQGESVNADISPTSSVDASQVDGSVDLELGVVPNLPQADEFVKTESTGDASEKSLTELSGIRTAQLNRLLYVTDLSYTLETNAPPHGFLGGPLTTDRSITIKKSAMSPLHQLVSSAYQSTMTWLSLFDIAGVGFYTRPEKPVDREHFHQYSSETQYRYSHSFPFSSEAQANRWSATAFLLKPLQVLSSALHLATSKLFLWFSKNPLFVPTSPPLVCAYPRGNDPHAPLLFGLPNCRTTPYSIFDKKHYAPMFLRTLGRQGVDLAALAFAQYMYSVVHEAGTEAWKTSFPTVILGSQPYPADRLAVSSAFDRNGIAAFLPPPSSLMEACHLILHSILSSAQVTANDAAASTRSREVDSPLWDLLMDPSPMEVETLGKQQTEFLQSQWLAGNAEAGMQLGRLYLHGNQAAGIPQDAERAQQIFQQIGGLYPGRPEQPFDPGVGGGAGAGAGGAAGEPHRGPIDPYFVEEGDLDVPPRLRAQGRVIMAMLMLEEHGAEGNAEDLNLAFQYLLEGAEYNVTEAFSALGYVYQTGIVPGVPVDMDRAFFYLRKAADLNVATAHSNLAALMLVGQETGATDNAFSNVTGARWHLNSALRNGNRYVPAEFNLALMDIYGWGLEELDVAKATEAKHAEEQRKAAASAANFTDPGPTPHQFAKQETPSNATASNQGADTSNQDSSVSPNASDTSNLSLQEHSKSDTAQTQGETANPTDTDIKMDQANGGAKSAAHVSRSNSNAAAETSTPSPFSPPSTLPTASPAASPTPTPPPMRRTHTIDRTKAQTRDEHGDIISPGYPHSSKISDRHCLLGVNRMIGITRFAGTWIDEWPLNLVTASKSLRLKQVSNSLTSSELLAIDATEKVDARTAPEIMSMDQGALQYLLFHVLGHNTASAESAFALEHLYHYNTQTSPHSSELLPMLRLDYFSKKALTDLQRIVAEERWDWGKYSHLHPNSSHYLFPLHGLEVAVVNTSTNASSENDSGDNVTSEKSNTETVTIERINQFDEYIQRITFILSDLHRFYYIGTGDTPSLLVFRHTEASKATPHHSAALPVQNNVPGATQSEGSSAEDPSNKDSPKSNDSGVKELRVQADGTLRSDDSAPSSEAIADSQPTDNASGAPGNASNAPTSTHITDSVPVEPVYPLSPAIAAFSVYLSSYRLAHSLNAMNPDGPSSAIYPPSRTPDRGFSAFRIADCFKNGWEGVPYCYPYLPNEPSSPSATAKPSFAKEMASSQEMGETSDGNDPLAEARSAMYTHWSDIAVQEGNKPSTYDLSLAYLYGKAVASKNPMLSHIPLSLPYGQHANITHAWWLLNKVQTPILTPSQSSTILLTRLYYVFYWLKTVLLDLFHNFPWTHLSAFPRFSSDHTYDIVERTSLRPGAQFALLLHDLNNIFWKLAPSMPRPRDSPLWKPEFKSDDDFYFSLGQGSLILDEDEEEDLSREELEWLQELMRAEAIKVGKEIHFSSRAGEQYLGPFPISITTQRIITIFLRSSLAVGFLSLSYFVFSVFYG